MPQTKLKEERVIFFEILLKGVDNHFWLHEDKQYLPCGGDVESSKWTHFVTVLSYTSL
jgi:hypothetical protein